MNDTISDSMPSCYQPILVSLMASNAHSNAWIPSASYQFERHPCRTVYRVLKPSRKSYSNPLFVKRRLHREMLDHH